MAALPKLIGKGERLAGESCSVGLIVHDGIGDEWADAELLDGWG
jgi:hypothetical protein